MIELKKRNSVIRKKQTLKAETKKTIRLLIITLSSMIVILLVAFLFLTSQSSQKGYALQQERLKNEYLKDINKNLTTKITESTAFTNLEETDKLDEMKELDEKTYITEEDNSI